MEMGDSSERFRCAKIVRPIEGLGCYTCRSWQSDEENLMLV